MQKTGNFNDSGRSGKFFQSVRSGGDTQSGLNHLSKQSGEGRSGFPLIIRSHNGISPYRAGEKNWYLPSASSFKPNASLENRIQAIGQSRGETIRIAAPACKCSGCRRSYTAFEGHLPNGGCGSSDGGSCALEPFELFPGRKTDVIFARQNWESCEWTPLYNELLYAILPKNYPFNGPYLVSFKRV